MRWLRSVVIVLAFLQAGWMTFDGARALVVGDYVTPASGERTGQLGAWSQVVKAIGIEPRSTLMKSLFVVYGIIWLVVIVCYLLNFAWAWFVSFRVISCGFVDRLASLVYLPRSLTRQKGR